MTNTPGRSAYPGYGAPLTAYGWYPSTPNVPKEQVDRLSRSLWTVVAALGPATFGVSLASPVALDYVTRQAGDRWQVVDVYLTGTISELATRRSEFAAILKNEGIDGLIAALNRKADLLTGTTASAF